MPPFLRSLFFVASCLLMSFLGASAIASPVVVTISSLKASSTAVQPGQTVTFTAVLTANQSISGYPIEFSWVPPNTGNGINAVVFVTYQANKSVTETATWKVPANAVSGSYQLILNAFNPSWNVPALAGATTKFAVTAPSVLAPVAVTVNSLKATPTTATSGQAVTFTAALTANQNLTGYPLELSLVAPGATTGQNSVAYISYTAGKPVTETTSWTVPTTASSGTYTLVVNAFNPAWQVPSLASDSTNFVVAIKSHPPEPGPSATLIGSPFYSCLRNFYVATTGKDTNSGALASPWQTIQHADTTSRLGGDCINVAAGTYNARVLVQHGGKSPTPTGYVVYRCQTLDKCHVLAPGAGHLWGFSNAGNFTVVDGFEVDGNNALKTDGIADVCLGSDGATYGVGNSAHHIWLLNNIIHHCNLAGISLNNKEWYYVLQNTVYHNAWTSGYQGSGIGFVVVQCVEKGNAKCASGSTFAGGTGTYVPSGMDITYMPSFHNIVSGNVAYDNMIASDNPIPCGSHTDGNGIIMDTFFDQATLSLVYPYQTLITNNISYGNGGRGIHVFRTSNVVVANNTAFGNGTDACLPAYYLADLSQSGGSNNVWLNNIAQSVLTPANPKCAYCGDRNAPLVAGNAGDLIDTNNVFLHNITYGGDGVQLFNEDVLYFSCANNKCKTNPDLVNPSSGNFALQAASPAIGYAQLESYLSNATADIGACSTFFQTCQ